MRTGLGVLAPPWTTGVDDVWLLAWEVDDWVRADDLRRAEMARRRGMRCEEDDRPVTVDHEINGQD